MRFAQPAHDLAQSFPLLTVLDAARDADMVDPGHHDEIAAGDADIGRDPRALGADRLLGDLDEDLLAFLQQVLDLRCMGALAFGIDLELQSFVLHHGRISRRAVEDVAHIEERGFFQAHIDERGLHAGQDLHDPALVDIPGNAAVLFAVDQYFGDQAVLQKGHAGFLPAGVYDDLRWHAVSSEV